MLTFNTLPPFPFNLPTAPRPQMEASSLSQDLLGCFKLSKIFPEPARLLSLDFHHSGEFCAVSGQDEILRIYNALEGKPLQAIPSKKYGISLVKYTTNSTNILFASGHSPKITDHAIRFLSTHDAQFIRYFKGHTSPVTGLDVCPTGDAFISASLNSVRLWDLKTPGSQGQLPIHRPSSTGSQKTPLSPPLVAMDPSGLTFALATDSRTIRLYDLRAWNQGPFSTFYIDSSGGGTFGGEGGSGFRLSKSSSSATGSMQWSSISYAPDKKNFLISTFGTTMLLVDAFEGWVNQRFEGNANEEGQPLQGTFTPDAQFVLCGGGDGSVGIWKAAQSEGKAKLADSKPFASLEGLGDAVGQVKFNPKYMEFGCISSGKFSLWIPDYNFDL